MKKASFTIILSLLASCIYATSNWQISDYFDNNKIFDIMRGDTITLQYVDNVDAIKLLTPDTTWIKKVKRPKENKHYILNWHPEGYFTEKVMINYHKYASKKFILQGAEYLNHSYILYLYDFFLNRNLTFNSSHSLFYIIDPKINQNIYTMFKDSVYAYKTEFTKEDEFCKTTQLDSCHFKLSGYSYQPLSYQYKLFMKDNIYSTLSKNGIKLSSRMVQPLSHYEWLAHDQKAHEILKNDSIVRLAKVTSHNAHHNGEYYSFEGDTMSIITYQKKQEYSWSTNYIYDITAYAYGKEFTIKIKDYHNIQDYIQFINPKDSTYLLRRGVAKKEVRLAVAKLWDKVHIPIITQDSIKSYNHIVWGTIESYDEESIKHVDENGNVNYEYAKTPPLGIRVPIYNYGKTIYFDHAWLVSYNGNSFAIDAKSDILQFDNDSDRIYLRRVGGQYQPQRRIQARIVDLDDRLEELKRIKAERDKKIAELVKKKIFLLSQDYISGEYDWCGIQASFLNCFSKTIKYINCTVVAYNTFGDKQGDDWGRSTKDIRCIGPLEPKEVASWNFDELFKNEKGIIKSFNITYIKITFIDNSTIIYNGWGNVKKHFSSTSL